MLFQVKEITQPVFLVEKRYDGQGTDSVVSKVATRVRHWVRSWLQILLIYPSLYHSRINPSKYFISKVLNGKGERKEHIFFLCLMFSVLRGGFQFA